MKKLIVFGVITAILLAIVVTVMAGKPSTAEFTWWQFYDGWGPAEYYEQPVLVEYTATNRWVLNKQATDGGWNIKQALTQNGTANVYDAASGDSFTDSLGTTGFKGELIESGLNFRVVENTIGFVTTDKNWYHVSQVDALEDWNYHWIIPGVYHYFGSYHNGQWDSEILFP